MAHEPDADLLYILRCFYNSEMKSTKRSMCNRNTGSSGLLIASKRTTCY